MDMKDRFTGCLLGLALGDAMGAPFEGSPPGGKSLARLPSLLRYTDDTEMALGVAESLTARRGLDPGHMAGTFARNFNPARGYGPGTTAVLNLIQRGVPWDRANRAVFPEGSFGNGAAMRAAPIGLFCWKDPVRLKEVTFGASAVTHDHPLAKEGALLITHAVALILQDKPPGEILDALMGVPEIKEYKDKLHSVGRLLKADEDTGEVIHSLGHGIEALESAPTAIYAFLRYGSDYLETIEFCLSLGGDTDTISAMAGALAGAYLGRGGLPSEFLERLEDRGRIEALAVGLLESSSQ